MTSGIVTNRIAKQTSMLNWLFLFTTAIAGFTHSSNSFTCTPPLPQGRSKTIFPMTRTRSKSSLAMSSLLSEMSSAVSQALNQDIELVSSRGAGSGGGGGASVGLVADVQTGTKFFCKSTTSTRTSNGMLRAEHEGVKAIFETNTIRVPRPIAAGTTSDGLQEYAVFEYLDFVPFGGDFRDMGRQLAKMHRCTSPDEGQHGFHIDNTIGATHQPNLPRSNDWAEFWDRNRLGHMLKLTNNAGLSATEVEALRETTKRMLSHDPQPSLLHGDLWGGNAGFARSGGDDDGEVVPVIFDPATYYGDREADLAMTHLFGGFGADFYQGYEEEWPLPEGHQQRITVYNLYHILNHEVLFGGYMSQARKIISQIMKY